MKIRLFAFLCLAATCLGLFSLAALPTQATEEHPYLVGYSKKDTNPWVDPDDHSKGFLLPNVDENGDYIIDENGNYQDGIPLAGYGSSETRPGLDRLDDNGDNVIDDADGLFTTCTVITDSNNTTMVFVTMDAISPSAAITKAIRASITKAFRAQGLSLYDDQIMISCSHSHTGPDTYVLSRATTETNPKQKQYYDYIINQITAAALEAYENRGEAQMTKTTVNASQIIGEKYNVPDLKMNNIRHYNIIGTLQHVSISGSKTTVLSTNTSPQLVSGANFGQHHSYDYMQTHNPWYHNLAKIQNGSTTEYYRMAVTAQGTIASADDTMDLLKFTVEDQDPIVLINWQAHPDNIGQNYISSDYIGGLRYRLENNHTLFGGENNYRTGFFQGASGNLSVRSAVGKATWETLDNVSGLLHDYTTADNKPPFVKYGYLLAEAAVEALEGGSAQWSKSLTGDIRHKQITYAADAQLYNEGLRYAAVAWNNGTPDADGIDDFPYAYDHTDGNRYLLSTKYHANKVLNKTVKTDGVYHPELMPTKTTEDIELNVIMIGTGLAMVTAPDELSDRYNSETLDYLGDAIANDWDKLVDDAYGRPMILGYTNDHKGYIANRAAYHYNENAVINDTAVLSVGSYEANNSNFAEGTGEKLIDIYDQMLDELSSENNGMTAYCQSCKETVLWTQLDTNTINASTVLRSGHYFLPSDISTKNVIYVLPGHKVCLDLCGNILSSSNSVLIKTGESGATKKATLNIMDSVGNGVLRSFNQTLVVWDQGEVNMYGGTVDSTAELSSSSAGCVYVTHSGAVFNLYDGTIRGGKVSQHGGAIYLWSETNETPAQFNMYGGIVIGGTAKYGAAISSLNSKLGLHGGTILSGTLLEGGMGDCVYYSSPAPISLSGNPHIDNLCGPSMNKLSWSISKDCRARIPGGVNYYNTTLSNNSPLGTVTGNAKLLSTISLTDKTGATHYLAVSGSQLIAAASDPNPQVATYGSTTYTSLADAMKDYTFASAPENVTCITLNKDVSTHLVLDRTLCLDLNGFDLTGGVTVPDGYTLYVMDSRTDSYSVPSDNCYGSITGVSGDVQAVPDGFGCVNKKEGNWYCGYIKLQEGEQVSFHRIDFGITDTQTNIKKIGIRYGCGFYADEKVSENFTGSYGIAVSIQGDPAPNGQQASHAANTAFYTFVPGGNTGNASYIKNILKEENSYTANKRNGETAIRGRAYFRLSEDGPTLYGPEQTTSLKETMVQINGNWENITLNTLKKQTYTFFNTFKSVMKNWNLANIETDAAAAQKAEEDAVLKVLTIGNSHSIDAMTMLYEVYQAENPDKQVELGILYYSGCQVDRHIQHIQNNYPAYQYYKINEEIMSTQGAWQINGSFSTPAKLPDWETMDNVVISSVYNKDNPVTDSTDLVVDGWTIDMALADEKWDVIVLQQMNNYAAQEVWYTRKAYSKTLTDFEWLIQYVKTRSQGSPRIGFHVTWANPMTDSTKTGYVNTTSVSGWKDNLERWYGNGNGSWEDENRLTMQHTMFAQVRNNTQKYIQPMLDKGTLDHLFFSGPAVQYAFDNAIKTHTAVTANENIYRDYTHLSHYGRLLAAYTWYATLEGLDSITEIKVNEIPNAILHPRDTSVLDLNGSVYNKQLMVEAVNYALSYNYTLPWG